MSATGKVELEVLRAFGVSVTVDQDHVGTWDRSDAEPERSAAVWLWNGSGAETLAFRPNVYFGLVERASVDGRADAVDAAATGLGDPDPMLTLANDPNGAAAGDDRVILGQLLSDGVLQVEQWLTDSACDDVDLQFVVSGHVNDMARFSDDVALLLAGLHLVEVGEDV